MFRRPQRSPRVPPRPPEAVRLALAHVEQARSSLLTAVPGRRGEGAPLADAVAAFEERLAAAREALSAWPPDVRQDVRQTCIEAIEESLRRTERLRLEASPQGYEELYVLLGEILDPLDAFASVAESLGVGRGSGSSRA